MSRSVVRIEHETNYAAQLIMLQWCLGNTCNFACSYCPPNLHDGSIRSLELAKVLRFCDRFITHYHTPQRQILVEFTGGEPTMYRDYVSLVQHLDCEGVVVSLSSNGSRTVRFWESVARYLDHVNLTFHAEFTEEAHLFSVVDALRLAQVTVHVNVMMLPAQFERCVAVAERLAATTTDVTIALQSLRYNIGDVLYPYTAAQREVLANKRLTIRWTGTRPQLTKGRMIEVLEDGTHEVVEPYQLIAAGRNRWKGWDCWAGLEELVVDYRGDIWTGWCQAGGRIGHVADDVIVFPTQPVRCVRNSCDCTLDVMNRRTLPILNHVPD